MIGLDLNSFTKLAEASYADFANKNITKLAVLEAKEFSTSQAITLLSEWTIANHQKNTSSGFSATLFQNKNTGQYVFAARGTEPGLTDLIADGADLVRDGLALDQIVDMYNYWKQITSPGGATYLAASLVTLPDETVAYNLARIGQIIPGNIQASEYLDALHSRTDIVIDEPSDRVQQIHFIDSNTVSEATCSQ